ncbi:MULTISPECIES: NAD-dependent succinate-semialdehyde dehydrogenase [unclassified Brevundimonas]|uniref:NAD-dependent succinate-semialdehyde dehydrogenase n=1 Tax=unclassified Brevundimonas TaxID=2622653 RepID=UPI000701E16A|nr:MULTISPECIES: NAD-dependent succinate-semialdehyde dehydrogenase [unclassified Brevundimonas]KQY91079.1 NAD-dependent succinate-semialdehyde dehydrogenase [Brevundimonas sp. Root1423]KRA22064.1 NAD-dependent succinate-semialdehyde dehydrogenase [Brevundimonas sp. Root608]
MNTPNRDAGLALMRQHALIAGEPVAANGQGIAVDDPATGEVIGWIPDLGAAETERAIAAAVEAFPDWSRSDPHRRAAFLREWARLVDENNEGLGALMALENGKPLEEARGEVAYASSFLKWFAGEAERLIGETQDSPLGHVILTFREAIGPCALITPWNFPTAMLTRKLGPAFAAGCTAVVKPASQTPFSAIALAELAYRAGLPKGALSIVTGDAATIGGVLTASPAIRKLSFTGSTPVGRKLAEQCAPTLKRVSMELGGAAPLIVFADADLDLAVAETIRGKFRNSGQTCVCPNRVYVEASVAEAYAKKLAAEVAKIPVGPAFEEGVKVGPLIEDKAIAKVEAHLEKVKASGGRVLTGGARHALGGRFFQPTVTLGGDDKLFRDEETFGPLIPVFPFDSEAEVLGKANDSEFGLASYVFTRDLDRAFRMGRGIEAGMCGVNTGIISTAAAPFGGVKASGYGREGSVHGIDEYVDIKQVTLALR